MGHGDDGMSGVDDEERQLRIDQMTINIEKMRSDMRWEARKFLVSAILAMAAAVGAGVAIGNLIWNHPQQPQPIVIQLPAPAR
ncbi:MAG: hypothetical protein QOG25_3808 [Acetobacteraceae bacterium]|jgi:hypothetical protein|nr:hypothetical protein [Acetobacteraceae bacterium]